MSEVPCLLDGGPFIAVYSPNILPKVEMTGELDLERVVHLRHPTGLPHDLSQLKSSERSIPDFFIAIDVIPRALPSVRRLPPKVTLFLMVKQR